MSRKSKGEALEGEALGTLLFDLAHDMRSPLLTLLGFTELAQESLHEPEALARLLASIERSTLRLNRLVEDLVNLARVQAPPPPPEPRPLHLRQALEELCREARRAWDLRGTQLEVEAGEASDHTTCDERSLRIAASALLLNAIEASPKGATVRLRVLPGAAGGHRVEIENEGPARSAAEQAALERSFEALSRGEDEGEAEGAPGMGLGLILVRRSCEVLQATFDLHAREGGGAVASLELPASA
ncbi:MAG: histidine kinase dimerization/phospho-acceptor domain-containing protein [Deltaproteobacteria bacterium]|nr:histidine kinase dimerization/phospho-acceptor domain-containing protein [Deltaproteobacteria bacterium]